MRWGRLAGGIAAWLAVLACTPHPSEELVCGGETIDGTYDAQRYTSSGASQALLLLSSVPVNAHLRQPKSGFATCPGAGADDGTFIIPDVPDEIYYLQIGSSYFVTRQRAPHLTYTRLGDHNHADLSTPVSFAVSGLNAWNTSDAIEVYSGDTGTALVDPEAVDPPAAGATSANFSVDFAVDPNAYPGSGTTWITQLQHTTTATTARYALTRAASESFSVEEGSSATLTAALAAVTQRALPSLNWRHEVFDALAPPHPALDVPFDRLELHTLPEGDVEGSFWSSADLLLVLPDDGAALTGITYGDPFPSDWTRLLRASRIFPVVYGLPGLAESTFAARAVFEDTFERARQEPLQPAVAPLLDVTVNGKSGLAEQEGVGLTPDVAWTLPSVPPEAVYVFVEHLVDQGGTTGFEQVAFLSVPTVLGETSVRIPPEVMIPGEHYFFALRALTQGDVRHDVDPLKEGEPTSFADVLTSAVTP